MPMLAPRFRKPIAGAVENDDDAGTQGAVDINISRADGQIIAEQGPFSTEQNLLTFNKYEICALVTKDSGKIGGTPEKLEAAREADVQVFYLKRPAFPNLRTGSTPAEVCGMIRRRLGRD